MGGGCKNGSTKPFEPIHQFAKRMNDNGKDTHLQYTNDMNARQSLSHMSQGQEWLAAVRDTSDPNIIVEFRKVRAGPLAMDAIKKIRAFNQCTPYDSSVASVKGSSALAVPSVLWEIPLRMEDTVVEGYLYVGGKRMLWGLPTNNEVRFRPCNPCVYLERRGQLQLPSVQAVRQLEQTIFDPPEITLPDVNPVQVLAYGALRVYTKVEKGDGRRRLLTMLRGQQFDAYGNLKQHGCFVSVDVSNG